MKRRPTSPPRTTLPKSVSPRNLAGLGRRNRLPLALACIAACVLFGMTHVYRITSWAAPKTSAQAHRLMAPRPESPRTRVTIPPLIHQTWKDGSVPAKHAQRVRSWTRQNPGFAYKMHSDADIAERVRTRHPYLLDAFHKMSAIHKADLFRYMVLFDEGGVYADVDTTCKRPVRDWARRTGDYFNTGLAIGIEVVTGSRPDWKKYFDRKIQICQWVMAAAPGHPVLARVLGKISDLFAGHTAEELRNISVCDATGPGIWSDAVTEHLYYTYNVTLGQGDFNKEQLANRFSHIGDIMLMPTRAFAVGSGGYRLDRKTHSDLDVFVSHHFAGSWKKKKKKSAKPRPWERDAQGRPWRSRSSGAGARGPPPKHRHRECQVTVLGGTACQYGTTPDKEGASNLFDGNPKSKWLQWVNFKYQPPADKEGSDKEGSDKEGSDKKGDGKNVHREKSRPSVNISYHGRSAFTLSAYSFVSANDAEARDPREWLVHGSDDNATWTLIDKQFRKNGLGGRGNRTTFRCCSACAPSGCPPYTHYRFTFYNVSDASQTTSIQLADIGLEGAPPPPPGAPQCARYPFTWSASRVCGPSGGWAESQSPAHALCPKPQTQWVHRWRRPHPVFFIIETARNAPFHNDVVGYSLQSARDHPGRDPSTWRLSVWSRGVNNTIGTGPVPDPSDAEGWAIIDKQDRFEFLNRSSTMAFSLDPHATRLMRNARWVKLEITALRDRDKAACDASLACLQIGGFSFQSAEKDPEKNPGAGPLVPVFPGHRQGRGGAGAGDSLKIPHIIHQSWKTKRLPTTLRPYVSSWIRLHPSWKYRMWTDDDCRELVRLAMPDFLETYDAYDSAILRADASRYLILRMYGGVYVDLDFEALKPISGLLHGQSMVLGQEPFAHSRVMYRIPHLVCNAFMASTPGHALWDTVFEELVRRKRMKGISSTGPRMLDAALTKYRSDKNQAGGTSEGSSVLLTHPDTLYPLFDDKNKNIRKDCERMEKTNPHWILSVDGVSRDNSTVESKVKKNKDGKRPALNQSMLTLIGTECDRLKQLKFSNPTLNSSLSYAAHHWVHTWFGSNYGGKSDFDVYETVADVRRKALEQDALDRATAARNNRIPSQFGDDNVRFPPNGLT